jgi:hypothetical protein
MTYLYLNVQNNKLKNLSHEVSQTIFVENNIAGMSGYSFTYLDKCKFNWKVRGSDSAAKGKGCCVIKLREKGLRENVKKNKVKDFFGIVR